MIAKELGVEIREEFKLKDVKGCEAIIFDCLYRFTETDFQFYNNGNWISTIVPTSLLKGIVEVEKLPFEPKKGEKYFVVSVVDKSVWPYTWEETTTDYCFKACGNCFRTEVEAEKHKYEIYEKLTGRKWEEEDG